MLRNTHDPYGSPAALVDKRIGNAYQAVDVLVRHLDEVRYVALNMELITDLANNLDKTARISGSTLLTAVMPADMNPAKLASSTVLVRTSTGAIDPNAMHLIDEDGVLQLIEPYPSGSTFVWTLRYAA